MRLLHSGVMHYVQATLCNDMVNTETHLSAAVVGQRDVVQLPEERHQRNLVVLDARLRHAGLADDHDPVLRLQRRHLITW